MMQENIEEDYDDDSGDEGDGYLQPGLRLVMTVDEMTNLGLSIFFTEERIQRATEDAKISWFVNYYGSSPTVCTIIWEDLQTTMIPEARIDDNKLNAKHYLMAMNHLKRYPTEIDRMGPWDVSRLIGRQWVWYFLNKIQALKTQKITWPADNFGTDIWAISVDGTHCWIQEPTHEEWSQDPSYFSHKYNKAGMNYEIAISLSEQRVVWLNGPFPAGSNDIKVFSQCGLEEKLRQIEKKAIGDKGYVGHPTTVSTYNNHDCRAVKGFKSRALKRHETFNGLTKQFHCISGRFRHSPDRFKTCFEAICVICQYKIENGSNLFDILVEDITDVDRL
jgi:hypothetical protein